MGWANYQLWVSGIGLVSATARFDEIIGAYLSSVQSYPDRKISVYEMANCRIVLSFPVNVELSHNSL